jgi:hypothetical protein
VVTVTVGDAEEPVKLARELREYAIPRRSCLSSRRNSLQGETSGRREDYNRGSPVVPLYRRR